MTEPRRYRGSDWVAPDALAPWSRARKIRFWGGPVFILALAVFGLALGSWMAALIGFIMALAGGAVRLWMWRLIARARRERQLNQSNPSTGPDVQ